MKSSTLLLIILSHLIFVAETKTTTTKTTRGRNGSRHHHHNHHNHHSHKNPDPIISKNKHPKTRPLLDSAHSEPFGIRKQSITPCFPNPSYSLTSSHLPGKVVPSPEVVYFRDSWKDRPERPLDGEGYRRTSLDVNRRPLLMLNIMDRRDVSDKLMSIGSHKCFHPETNHTSDSHSNSDDSINNDHGSARHAPEGLNSYENYDYHIDFSGVDHTTAASNNSTIAANSEVSFTWETGILATLGALISLLTVGGNLIVILSFVLERAIRQPANYFIASLAVSDLLIGLVSMPLYTMYVLTSKRWTLGEVFCDVWLSIDYTACLCSIYTVFCITIDRFCSIKIPTKYRLWRTEKKVGLLILG